MELPPLAPSKRAALVPAAGSAGSEVQTEGTDHGDLLDQALRLGVRDLEGVPLVQIQSIVERKVTAMTEMTEKSWLARDIRSDVDADSKEASVSPVTTGNENAESLHMSELDEAWLGDFADGHPVSGIRSRTTAHGLEDLETGESEPAQPSRIFNALAKLPALHSFGMSLGLIFWLPRHAPVFGAWLCIGLFAYGMGKFFTTGMFAVRGFLKMADQEDRMTRSRFLDVKPPAIQQATWSPLRQDDGGSMGNAASRRAPLSPRSSVGPDTLLRRDLDATDVVHCVLIPCYKESVDTISATVQTLAEQTIANQVTVVLAMEARDQTAEETARAVKERFGKSRLVDIVYTKHQLKRGETAGKSSNENWGFRIAKRWLCDAKGIPMDNIVFTTCDADTFFHPRHFEYLAHLYSESEERHRTVWQGVVCFLPNSAHLPVLCSVRYMLLTIGYLGQLASTASPTGPFPLSVYSLSARLADEVDYWDPSVVPEDWHMFFRVNLESRPDCRATGVTCTPMFVPIGCLGVEAASNCQTFIECYKQAVRWQWGAIDLAYLLMQLFLSPTSLARKAMLLLGLWEHHLLYPVMWVGLVTLPSLYPNECLEVDGWWIRMAVRAGDRCLNGVPVHDLLFKLWLVFVVVNALVMLCLDWAYRQHVAGRTHFESVPQGRPTIMRSFSFFLFPLADIILFVAPTFHAHIKMFLSTDFVYIVSPKENTLRAKAEAEAAAAVAEALKK